MRKKIKVAIVDHQTMNREAVASRLKLDPGIKVVFEAGNGAEAIEFIKGKKVDVLLLNLELPIVDGRSVIKKLTEKRSNVSILVLSNQLDKIDVKYSILAGAKGFLCKECSFEKVVETIYKIYTTGSCFESFIYESLAHDDAESEGNTIKSYKSVPLTAREVEIVELVCDGFTNNRIAKKLFLSKRTIDRHREKISEKTETKCIAELVIYAIKKGIYDLKKNVTK